MGIPSFSGNSAGMNTLNAFTDGNGGFDFFKGIGNINNAISGVSSSNEFNSYEAGLARQFNASEAQKQRDYEERLANTQYQRTVKDMLAAGINPASLTTGAALNATPSGASASGHAASSGSGVNALGGILNSITRLVGTVLIANNKTATTAMNNQTRIAVAKTPRWNYNFGLGAYRSSR